jgi:Gpi18-like mannosyltransferase
MIRDRPLWLLLAVALGVRLLLMPLPDPFDADLTAFWLPWMAYGAENGLAQLYQSGQPLVNYPPLYLALLVGMGELYGLVVPSFEYTSLQSVLIKLPAVVADLAITVLLYGAAQRVVLMQDTSAPSVCTTETHDRTTAQPNDRTTTHWFPLVAAGLWALNPAIIYVSAFWAQVDSIHTLWMLAALLAALARRWGWSGLFMGLALLTKLHAFVLLPLLLVLAWRNSLRAVAVGAVGAAGTLALGLLPFVLSGAGAQVLAVYGGSVGFYPKLSVNAFNGWFLVQTISAQAFGSELLDTAQVVGQVTLRWVGLGLLAGYMALVIWRLWPTLERPAGRVWLGAATQLLVFFAAGLLVFGFFSLPTEMHERYGLPALAFLALPAAMWRRVLWPYLLLTACFSANLLRVLPWGPGVFWLLESIPGDRLLVSAASVLLFIWLTILYLAQVRRQRAAEPASGALGEGS